jgi:hypothetical protein
MAELVGMFVVGAVLGGLIVAAWHSDWIPPDSDIHSGPQDLESRARRVQ